MLQNGSMNLCWNNLNSIIFFKNACIWKLFYLWFSIWVDFSAKSVDIFFSFIIFLHSLWILFAFLTSVLRKKMEMRSGCLWLKRWWRFFISVGENNMFYINNEFALKWVSKKKWPHLTKFSKNTPFGRHYKTRALTWSHLPRGLIVNISLFSYNAVQPSTSIMKQKVQSSSVC